MKRIYMQWLMWRRNVSIRNLNWLCKKYKVGDSAFASDLINNPFVMYEAGRLNSLNRRIKKFQ